MSAPLRIVLTSAMLAGNSFAASLTIHRQFEVLASVPSTLYVNAAPNKFLDYRLLPNGDYLLASLSFPSNSIAAYEGTGTPKWQTSFRNAESSFMGMAVMPNGDVITLHDDVSGVTQLRVLNAQTGAVVTNMAIPRTFITSVFFVTNGYVVATGIRAPRRYFGWEKNLSGRTAEFWTTRISVHHR